MSAADNTAIFLSYASQDAEAARSIYETLRGEGVEVWFDADGGLEHGDEWDAKIRRQIKECVLFIPLISANTQAREEGYFRLEWDLAAERARTIASGVPFILPVVIDDTREPEALVPDRFRMVQWTRLSGGVVTPEVKARYLKLWSHRTGALKHESDVGRGRRTPPSGSSSAEAAGSGDPALQPNTRRRVPPAAWFAAAATVAVAALYFTLRPAKNAGAGTHPPTAERSAPPPQPASGKRYASSRPDVAVLLTRVQAMTDKADVARAELETALSLLDQAAKLDSTDASVWAERALVEFRYVTSSLDYTPARIDAARQHAKQATSLDPKNPHARLADALTQLQAATDQAGRDAAAAIFESLVAENTDRVDAYFALARRKFRNRQTDEALALLDRAARLPGAAGRAAMENAIRYALSAELSKANEALDQALVLERSADALLWKSYLAMVWLGDAALAKRLIADIPPGMLTEDFPASGKLFVALWARDWDTVIATMRAIPRNYLGSGALSGPTGYYLGYALARDGRKSAAEVEWRSALEVVNKRFESDPRDQTLFRMKALLLAALGDRTGGEKTLQTLRELLPTTWARSWEGHMLAIELLPPEEAIAQLANAGPANMAWGLSGSLKLDPFVDHLRSHPKFIELLAKAESDPKLNPAAAKPAATAPAPGEKSVAVLAFANLSDDKANEYFSDGISEELLNVLAKVPGLKVSARTSAFSFKGKNVPIPEIAQQLGVAYVVEGSVRKAGNQVRITAQLIKAADGFQTWSETFTRELKDIFAVQDEIAGLIAKNLSLTLGAGATTPVAATVNPEAYRLYLEGRAAWNRRDAEGFRQAELLLNRALELEPRFARAHAALADLWTVQGAPLQGSYGQRQSPRLARIIAKAEQAVALDGNSAEAHASLGHALGQAWRFADAQRALRRAIELNPNYASAHQWLGRQLLVPGQLDEGLAALRRAVELDPLSHRILDNYSDALENAGRLAEAWAVLGRASALHPTGVQIRCKQVLVLMRLGRRDEALAAARALAADAGAEEPDYRYSTASAALAAFGETREAEALFRRIATDSEDLPVALAYAGRVREFVPRLDDLTINWITILWFDPAFAPIRADAGFRAWTKRVGLADGLARAEAWLAAHPPGKPAR